MVSNEFFRADGPISSLVGKPKGCPIGVLEVFSTLREIPPSKGNNALRNERHKNENSIKMRNEDDIGSGSAKPISSVLCCFVLASLKRITLNLGEPIPDLLNFKRSKLISPYPIQSKGHFD